MMKLRIDVDYPYPSRAKSFLSVLLRSKIGKDYLKNSKIIAKMVNESPVEVKAYWFFTYKTIPDNELLGLLHGGKHEVALHVVNNPYAELELLKKATKRKIDYYTVHGTARLLAQLIWRRKLGRARAQIQEGFPLKSFHDFPTFSLDYICHINPAMKAEKMAEASIAKGEVLEIHPDWLFNRGTINHRGPYYDTLRRILSVDKELETIATRKKLFFRIAQDGEEYQKDIVPTEALIIKLAERGVDIFNFLERKWCHTISNPAKSWIREKDNVGLLHLTSYAEWWKNIGKKTRNMIRKAEKTGTRIDLAEPNEKLIEGIWRIYNETPIRQGRPFIHYGAHLQAVAKGVRSFPSSTYIGAYLNDEFIGFIQLIHGDNVTTINQILSMQKHWDKALNNALIAKAVEFCANKQIQWLMYGRMGNHPSLDKFKESNSFVKFPLNRYYVPITKKGRIAVKLGLHRELKDAIPQSIKPMLFPLYNWWVNLRFGKDNPTA